TKPAICIVDLQIGDAMAGFALIQTIRKCLGDALPVFVASAHTDPAIVAHTLELGADDFIAKPLDPALLGSKLKLFVGTTRAPELPVKTVPAAKAFAEVQLELAVLSIDELGV